jgi:hypothetical protein
MEKNTGRQNNFLQPMMRGSMHLGAQVFFLLGEGGGVGFLRFPMCSHEVLTVFPSNSRWVPSMFPKFSICSPHVQYLFWDYPKLYFYFL